MTVAPTTPPAAPETWLVICGVGGWVCAAPDPTGPDGICGMPTESEPCHEHGTTTTMED